MKSIIAIGLLWMVQVNSLALKMWDRYEEIHNDDKFMPLLEKLELWPGQ